jgi:hypothetical protein
MEKKMKPHLILAAAVLAAGCQQPQQTTQVDPIQQEAEHDENATRSAFDQDVHNAIVLQRVVYEHHFNPSTASLNDLGMRQIKVLAEAYHADPVRISVLRGDASNELYEKRVQAVREQLVHNGVDVAKVALGDDMPGGPGIPSEYIWISYKQALEGGRNTTTTTNNRGGTTGRMSDYSSNGRQQ